MPGFRSEGSKMEINQAEFVKSSTDLSQCPDPVIPEYAFIGRSNVGKSSLINMLTSRNNLAKTSSNPGKTQCINHFEINGKGTEPWYLVDLPGYGYAKVSKTSREKWMRFIRKYLLERANLMCVFVLLDGRHKPQKIDLEFMEWLGTEGIPFVMVFTKLDKLGAPSFEKNLKAFSDAMLEVWEELPKQFFTSSEKKRGKEELLNFIEESNPLFEIPE